jgi:hypothetical protein
VQTPTQPAIDVSSDHEGSDLQAGPSRKAAGELCAAAYSAFESRPLQMYQSVQYLRLMELSHGLVFACRCVSASCTDLILLFSMVMICHVSSSAWLQILLCCLHSQEQERAPAVKQLLQQQAANQAAVNRQQQLLRQTARLLARQAPQQQQLLQQVALQLQLQ